MSPVQRKYSTDKSYAINIHTNQTALEGNLFLPPHAKSIVLLAHVNGGEFNLSTQHIAHTLNKENIATLLFDLLTPEEEHIDNLTSILRFNIEFLTTRLIRITHWILDQIEFAHLPIGYLCTGTGTAAALQASTQNFSEVKAIVSRSGRPDLAGTALLQVKAPTLLIVGGHAPIIIALNKTAMIDMPACPKKLKIIPGATHLFRESGTLELTEQLTRAWFLKYLI